MFGNWEVDDKNLVVICATIIAVVAMFTFADPETIVTSVTSGLFGVAVGKSLKEGS